MNKEAKKKYNTKTDEIEYIRPRENKNRRFKEKKFKRMWYRN